MNEYLEESCLFCKIIRGEIPSQKIFENEFVLAIRDINPLAEHHILVLPKYHIENYFDEKFLEKNNQFLNDVLLNVHSAIAYIVKEQNLENYGVRVIQNNGVQIGQSVNHIHWHIIAGESADKNLMDYYTEFYKTK